MNSILALFGNIHGFERTLLEGDKFEPFFF